ncbi:hypothetical protein [Leucothrix pacifica]|uniref:5-bromo-4-chloroindolyl phosphate hydrolysis protein n=1 Tax=Leucothrix pacifica TaxID=1247513 RepID=A0A317CV04_9GAMM|nr:hypothetical protein [Leucothrix pacifica]PWR00331.1 hypothetical protein DKW60_01895 [Leucothrix pacifica]
MIKRYTLIAAILSLILLLAFFWWFQGNLLATGIYAVISVISILTVPLFYRFAGYSDVDDEEWLEEREAREHEEMRARLMTIKSELSDLGLKEGVRQTEVLTAIIDDYHSVVETRFYGKANVPTTYLSAARTVQKHAIQNLADVVATGHSISTLSHTYRQADQVENNEQQKRHDKQTVLQDEQEARLNGFLEENNQLFHSLTETAVEIANIRSFSDYERTDALARLVALAEIANNSGR